jgi:hypothetical protein
MSKRKHKLAQDPDLGRQDTRAVTSLATTRPERTKSRTSRGIRKQDDLLATQCLHRIYAS